MKKLSILLLAAVMIFTCFALAACGDKEETSSPADTSTTSSADNSSATSSASDTSSKTETTSEPESSAPEASEPETSEPDNTDDTSSVDGEVNTDPSPFWITHYDDPAQEGAGMILTSSDTAGEWCDHYAFKPIEGVENGYELVSFSYGTIADGDATYNGHGEKLEFPEGGFIYATSIGNNWKTDEGQADGIDYVNDNCNEQISRCRTWKVGDQFIITGMDLEGKTIPKSSGDDIMWYEDGYVCTATIAPLA